MFGANADDTRVSAARKLSYMNDAMSRWPWLTAIDCLGFRTVDQFVAAVQRGYDGSPANAAAEVALWMRGKSL